MGAMTSQMMLEEDKPLQMTSGLKKNYLYLDTCTTNDQMVNPSYLREVHEAKDSLALYTNVGTSIST